jgi:hypothetical protein
VGWLSALAVAVGPGAAYVGAHFGTPVFGLACALTWVAFWQLLTSPTPTFGRAAFFSAACLAMGLIRPEGALFAAFFLAALVAFQGLRRSLSLLRVFAGIFGVAGTAYFAWRWGYFGHPLPNPAYKKGGFALANLVLAVRNAAVLTLPFAAPMLAGLVSGDPTQRRRSLAIVAPAAAAALSFAFLSNEMNFGLRFQYPVFLFCVLSCWPVFAAIWPREGARVAPPVVLAVGAAVVGYVAIASKVQHHPDGRAAVARALRPFADRGYTLVTSEAGLLPFYSGWRSVDAWGLNDREIAHGSGAIDLVRLRRERPQLIVLHETCSPLLGLRCPESADAWSGMVRALHAYAQEQDFAVAALWGESPFDTHTYLVARDFKDSAQVVEAIRGVAAYPWYASGGTGFNFAPLAVPVRAEAGR